MANSEHAGPQNAGEYIAHHLTHYSATVLGDGKMHWDTFITSGVLGVIAFGFLFWVSRQMVPGVPSKLQTAVELLYGFVEDNVKGVFNPTNRSFVVGLCFTIFVWIFIMNAMDFLPVDIVALVMKHVFQQENWRHVPTSDLNTTLALSLSVVGFIIFFSIKAKGLGGWLHELTCTPFGPWLFPVNILFQGIEYISKPLSLALRLYGNMYAGEIIFLLINLLGAVSAFGAFVAGFLSLGWAIFHILIVFLQAFVFMMLTAVYLNMAHEHH